jgi:hypothetical protein
MVLQLTEIFAIIRLSGCPDPQIEDEDEFEFEHD